MRHQTIGLLETVAVALHAEAKYRQGNPGIPPAEIREKYWRFYKVPPVKSAWVRIFQWINWTLMTLMSRGRRIPGKPIWTEKAYITVYFGAAPVYEKASKWPDKDRRKAVRKMREILRLREFPANAPTDLIGDQPELVAPRCVPALANGRLLVIDGATSIETIKEQLAVFCAQLSFGDESVWNYLRSKHKSEDVLHEIIEKFIDPAYPGSYGDFVGRLRRAASRKTWEHRRPTRFDCPLGLTISEASAEANIARSTLYDLIRVGRLKAAKDKGGVLRIPLKEVQKIAMGIREKEIWRDCMSIKAGSSNPVAARKWIERKKKQREKAADVLRYLNSPNATI
jgi:excisionase family DNA binding protein